MDEKKRAPKLRFKGFTDDWEQRKLGEITARITRKNHKLESVLPLTISAQYGLVDQREFFNKQIASKKLENYLLIKHGEYAYNKSYSKEYPFGVIKRLNRYSSGVLSTLYIAFTPMNINSDYLEQYYDSTKWYREIYKRATEGARNHGLLNISPNDFFESILKVPGNKLEQSKITECLKLISELITLQQRKLDQLKLLKKAMFQQLFTDNKTPILRFRGFNIAWKQCTLGDLVKIVGGGTPSTKISKYWNGNINWYSPTEIGDQIYVNSSKKKITELGLKNSSAKILPGNRTILFTSRAGIGDMAIMTNDGTTNQGFQSWVINSNKVDIYFLYSLGKKLKKQAFRKASGSTFLEISNSEVKKLSLFTPSFEEQTNIGNFLKTIDNQITLQQENINRLEQIKKFLLQNMFI